MKKATPILAGVAAAGLLAATAVGIAQAQGTQHAADTGCRVRPSGDRCRRCRGRSPLREFPALDRRRADLGCRSACRTVQPQAISRMPRWNSWRNAQRANELPVGEHFVCVQSIVPDGHGNLWVLDPGAPGNEKILEGAPKLVRRSI